MSRLERIVARLPEATRVDVEEWVRTSYGLIAPKALARQLPDIASS
ncbi:MAG TPA: hypothetical protein VNA67_09720 [Pseudonocardiaceae bacterium]|nr:hypothetical protein [Pseudonocardiaceae bacterium]